MRVSTVIAGAFLLSCVGLSAQPVKSAFPDLIQLPEGFGPEGIAVGKGSTFFVGAGIGSTPDILGQILVGDLRTGTFSQLVPPTKKHALGMKFDGRTNLLYVAGGPSGTGRVYDAASGVEVASYQFQVPAPTGQRRNTQVNDVVVTQQAVWFTDSNAPSLYRVALGENGEPAKTFETVSVQKDIFGASAGTCGPNAMANGIAADPSGKRLIIGHSKAGKVFLMDVAKPDTVVPITLTGGDVCNADGLLLDGKTLYVVQNANNRIAVIELSADFTSGVIKQHIQGPFATNAKTKVPTTIAEFGNSLYAVTGGFAPPTPDFVVRLPK
jgi:hypothetical protein